MLSMGTFTLFQSISVALLKYLQREVPLPKCGTLSVNETEQVNGCMRQTLVSE